VHEYAGLLRLTVLRVEDHEYGLSLWRRRKAQSLRSTRRMNPGVWGVLGTLTWSL
jgi:hypothetical protein